MILALAASAALALSPPTPAEAVLEATLTPAPGREVPGFGGVLAYADPWLFVGWGDVELWWEEPDRPVHVFLRVDERWVLHSVLEVDSEGRDVALATDGDRLAVGLVSSDRPGQVLTFERVEGTWMRTDDLRLAEERASRAQSRRPEAFGAALALAGDRLFVGVPRRYDPSCSPRPGSVLEYGRWGAGWELANELDDRSFWVGSYFGGALAVGRDVLLAVAPGVSPGFTSGSPASCSAFDLAQPVPSGHPLLFERMGHDREPVRVGSHVPPYARSVAVEGQTIVVANPLFRYDRESPDRRPRGSVHVFTPRPDLGGAVGWAETGRVDNPSELPSRFGEPVALSSRFLVAGWRHDLGEDVGNSHLGELVLHVFARNGDETFTPRATIARNPRERARVPFGQPLATQGSRVVVGAPGEHPEDGQVLVYRID